MTDIVERLREAAKMPKEKFMVDVALNEAADEIDRLRAALREIALSKGQYSIDPLTHASNTIEDMQALARSALGGKP